MTRIGHRRALSVLLAGLASTALAQSAPAPADFVLFGHQNLRARGLIVDSGDVGANVSLRGSKRITAPNSRIVASTVDLHPASSCAALLANAGQRTAACGPVTPVSTPIIADLAAACGAPNPFPTCTPSASVFVAHDATTVLPPGSYGDLIVSGGGAGPGTLILTGGTYTFCNVRVNRNGQFLARAAVEVNITGTTKFDNGSNVGPEAGPLSPCQVRFFSNGSKFRVSRRGHLRGVVCAPNAKLEFTAGATLRGVFFGREVKTDKVTLQHEDCLTATTTTTTTTTLPGPLCGNGVVDPSEPCDLSSPSGAFCPEGDICTAQCLCQPPTTTTTTSASTSSSTSSSTSTSTSTSTTTTTDTLCGNGVVDPSEPCDLSSPNGAFTCPQGFVCSAQCTCEQQTTTSTTSSTTSSSSTTTTSATNPSSTTSSTSTSTSTSTSSSTSSSTSTPIPTTTTSTGAVVTTTSSTSTSSTSSSTTTSTTSSSTTTTGGVPTAVDFLSTAGTGSCGQTFRDLAGTTPLKNLLCGNLSLGGGLSQVLDNTTPAGATNRFGLSCAGSSCTVGPHSPATSAYDCTNTGCFFGTPLPIANAGLSVCVTNTFSEPVAGTLDLTTGAMTMTNYKLNSATVLTGNPNQPCPRCVVAAGGAVCVGSVATPCTGVCDGSPNQGSACTTKNPNGLTGDCPSPAATGGANPVQRCFRGTNNNLVCNGGADCPGGLCAQFIGDIAITLNPLTTGTTSLSATFNPASCTGVDTPFACCTGAGTGNCTAVFCPTQDTPQKGAFRSAICASGINNGKPCTTGNPDCPTVTPGVFGQCKSGALDNYCATGANSGLSCTLDADCGTGGDCVRAGTQAQLIRATGTPAGALSIGVGKAIKLASVFCVGATTNGTVNGNANLPGPGATTIVGQVTTLIP